MYGGGSPPNNGLSSAGSLEPQRETNEPKSHGAYQATVCDRPELADAKEAAPRLQPTITDHLGVVGMSSVFCFPVCSGALDAHGQGTACGIAGRPSARPRRETTAPNAPCLVPMDPASGSPRTGQISSTCQPDSACMRLHKLQLRYHLAAH